MSDNLVEDSVLSQYVPGFRANLNMAPQQTMTKLLDKVDGDLNYDAAGEMFNADDLLPSDPEDNNSRVPNTPDKFLGFTRRVGAFLGFHDSAWFPIRDKVRELEDPTSKAMMNLNAGRWRRTDSAIITAGLGNATNKNDNTGSYTTTALPAGQLVSSVDVSEAHDAEVVPTDGSDYGMAVGKLIHAGLLLDDSELEGERFLAWSSQQKADLLRRTPATSRYYAEVMALNAGTIDHFMGFTIVQLPKSRVPLYVNGNAHNIRSCMAWIKPAIIYKGRPIVNVSIKERADKGNTPQAYYSAEHGAVRRYDKAVVQIDCKE